MNTTLLIVIGLFTINHFIMDVVCQTPYQFQHKHILGHPGGIIHTSLHAFTSWLILGFIFGFLTHVVVIAVIFEFFAHYFIDFFKRNFTLMHKLTPADLNYWYVSIFDQLLHYLTYFCMIYYII